MKLIFVIIATTITISSAFSCSCYGPGIGKKEVIEATTKFVESKLSIKSEDIIEINTTNWGKNYLTYKDKTILFVLGSTMESEAEKECEEGCAASQNQRFNVLVSYKKIDQQCSQDLIVKLEKNIFSDGYKSIVVKNKNPTCH